MDSSPAQASSAGSPSTARGAHTPRGEAQREALARAAFELIAERGFEGLRTRDVAARAGVNIATLHYYFATKEDLIRAVVLMLQERFANVRPLYGEPGAAEPLEELRREFSDAAYQARAIPETFIVLFELYLRGLRDPAIRAILQALDAQWQEHIGTYLADGVRAGIFRADLDVPTTAAALITFVKGSLTQALLHGEAYPMREVQAQVEDWLTAFVRPVASEHSHPHPHSHAHPQPHVHDHHVGHNAGAAHAQSE
jgi:AcrR family transcriptional regulator